MQRKCAGAATITTFLITFAIVVPVNAHSGPVTKMIDFSRSPGAASGEYWFQVGAAAASVSGGYGDRFGEPITGASVEIRVLSPQNLLYPDTDLSYWVGIDLPNDAFIQAGYSLTPQTRNGMPSWFWEYFLPGTAQESTGPFLGKVGDAIGPNASWIKFSIESSGTTWSAYVGGQSVGSVDLGVSNSGTNGPYASAEVAGVKETDNILGPVEFRNLSYRDVQMTWHKTGAAVASCCYSVASQELTGVNYPYGVASIQGDDNHWLAGSNLPYAAKGEYLWPWYYLDVRSPFGSVSGTGWHVYRSQAAISVTPTTVPADGWLGQLGVRMTFVGWNGDYAGSSPTITLTVDSAKTVKAIWNTEYGPIIPAIASSSFVAIFLAGLEITLSKVRVADLRNKRVVTPSVRMFCPHCGMAIRRKTNFCVECGAAQ